MTCRVPQPGFWVIAPAISSRLYPISLNLNWVVLLLYRLFSLMARNIIDYYLLRILNHYPHLYSVLLLKIHICISEQDPRRSVSSCCKKVPEVSPVAVAIQPWIHTPSQFRLSTKRTPVWRDVLAREMPWTKIANMPRVSGGTSILKGPPRSVPRARNWEPEKQGIHILLTNFRMSHLHGPTS